MEENIGTGEYYMSPESQFEDIKDSLGSDLSPSQFLEWADTFDLIPKLLQVEEAAFLVPYYNLVTEIKRLAGIDDKDQFASFLIANRELVQKYPSNKVLELICKHSAVACATALLESGIYVDINSVYESLMTPLHIAAHNLSYGMTKLLLDHGADTEIKLSALSFGSPLNTALSAFSKLKMEGCTAERSLLNIFCFFSLPELKEPIDTIRLLASHCHQVEDLCITLMNRGADRKYALLLSVAWDKLMVSSAEGGLETTPVGQHISRGLRNASYLDEICNYDRDRCNYDRDRSIMEMVLDNLKRAWYVVKTMWMSRGVLERYYLSRAESVPMYELPFYIPSELNNVGLGLKPDGVNIQCLLPKLTSKAKVLPERKCYVEPQRSGPILCSFHGKLVRGASNSLSLSCAQYRTIRILNPMENHMWKSPQVKPSSHNVLALAKVCAPLMWFAKRSIK